VTLNKNKQNLLNSKCYGPSALNAHWAILAFWGDFVRRLLESIMFHRISLHRPKSSFPHMEPPGGFKPPTI
jgi:hypothetical protein